MGGVYGWACTLCSDADRGMMAHVFRRLVHGFWLSHGLLVDMLGCRAACRAVAWRSRWGVVWPVGLFTLAQPRDTYSPGPFVLRVGVGWYGLGLSMFVLGAYMLNAYIQVNPN